jgi:hypothetical protein
MEGQGSARRIFVALSNVSNTVKDLEFRLATTLSKELSNSIS